MKLHLPSGLRKALLSCLAALAMPVCSATLGTATSAFAGAAIISFIASQHAAAEFTGPDSLQGLGTDVTKDFAFNLSMTTGEVEEGTNNRSKNLDSLSSDNGVLNVQIKGYNNGSLCYYGGEELDVKIVKTGAQDRSLLSDGNEEHVLKATNVWLTSIASGNNNYFTVNQAGYISSSVQNIYVNNAGLHFDVNLVNSPLEANLIIGSATPGSNAPVAGCTLMFSQAFKTIGYLEVVEDAKIGFNGSNFRVFVGSLKGSGNLTLVSGGNGVVGGILAVQGDSADFSGRLIFETPNGKTANRVELANDVTLSVGGLEATNGGFIMASGAAANFIIDYSGADGLTATGVTFGNGLTVVKKGSGTQILDRASFEGEITLSGTEGALKLTNATFAADASITITDGSAIEFTDGNFVINGGSTVTFDDPLQLGADVTTIHLTTTDSDGTTPRGGTLELNDTTGLGGKNWELDKDLHLTVNDNLDVGSGSFTAHGDVTLTIAKGKTMTVGAANITLNGDLRISTGTLKINSQDGKYEDSGVILADGAQIYLEAGSYRDVRVAEGEHRFGIGWGVVFKSLSIEGESGIIRVGNSAVNNHNKSGFTINDKYTLGKNQILTIATTVDHQYETPVVYFKSGADFSAGTLKFDTASITIAAGDSGNQSSSIVINKIDATGKSNPNKVDYVRFISSNENAVIELATDESYTVDRGLYTDKASKVAEAMQMSEDCYGRFKKTGTGIVTFDGISIVDYINIQEGGIAFDGSQVTDTYGASDIAEYIVSANASIGFGTKNAIIYSSMAIEGDLDLFNQVNFGMMEGVYADTDTKLYVGGLTTSHDLGSDNVKDRAVFLATMEGFPMATPYLDFQINVEESTAVKRAYGVNLMGIDLTKLGKGTQVLSNFTTIGSLTIGAEETPNPKEFNNIRYGTDGGILELRGRGDVVGRVRGYDKNATLMLAQLSSLGGGLTNENADGMWEHRDGRTLITFAQGMEMESKLGLSGGVEVALGSYIEKIEEEEIVHDNVVGGITGDVSTGSHQNWNWIRKMTVDDRDNIYYNADIWVDFRPIGWKAQETMNLIIDIGEGDDGEPMRVTHHGMVGVEKGITLVKDGVGMQEMTGIRAETLIVKEGRFRITGVDEYGGQGWLGHRVIDNIIVDGAKDWTKTGEKSYFEVSVQDANYWTIPDSTMTLRNGGIFRAAGMGVNADTGDSDAVTSQFYVGKLYVSRTVQDDLVPEGAADGVIKWNTDDKEVLFPGDDMRSRDNNSHKFIFGLLSSVDENGVVDSTKDYLLEIDPMERTKKTATQGVIFRTIKDFNGTISADTGSSGNGNYFQIGMDVADVGFATTESGRTGLDTSMIDTVNTGAYAEDEDPEARGNVFNTTLYVEGSGVYSEVFRKRGDGELTINGDNGLTIGRDGQVGGGVIFMNYAGNIVFDSVNEKGYKISVGNDVTLLYTTGENNVDRGSGRTEKGGVIDALTVEQLVTNVGKDRLYIDLLHLENVEDLYMTETGISLGIQGNGEQSDLDRLKPLINLRGILTEDNASDGNEKVTTWELKWGEANEREQKTVYLHVTSDKVYFVEDDFLWDKAWGGVAYFAPTKSEMSKQEFYVGAVKADNFTFQGDDLESNSFVLFDSGYKAESMEDANSQDRMSIRLIGGGVGIDDPTTATVIGGKLYKAADKDHDTTDKSFWEVRGNSYISLMDPSKYGDDVTDGDPDELHFHLLVGGSSCIANVADNSTMGDRTKEAVGGFKGNSHIQMNGGQVDYIVGGNHVNNSAFIFRGRSFISVLDGEVFGGIVGGSTLTKGSVNKYTQAFDGSTHIFIYTPLTNKDNIEDTPAISDGTESAEGVSEAKFTAIVGGNAWIDLPRSVVSEGELSLRPTFRGNSNIVIDLSNVEKDNEDDPDVTFEKDLVGGNYTVYHGNKLLDSDGKRGSEYISNGLTSYVMVTAKANHAFTGSINGASRRASAGAGETYYTGDVLVRLRGGEYHKAVVGGLWLDASASGDHVANLVGNTVVDAGNNGADDAHFWRLVGGSFSLAGGDGSKETSTGTSTVNLWSGTVSNEHADYADDIAGMAPDSLRALQLQVAVVVGGNLYRNNSGNSQTRTGDTYVNLYGGNLDGVHVVGGDQVNSSTTPGVEGATGATIVGTSHVTVGTRLGEEMYDPVTSALTEGVTINGLIVGGSYLTDAGTGGSVTVKKTEIYLRGTENAEVEIIYEQEENEQGKKLHTHSLTEIAIVGGNMLVDQETGGSHKLVVEDSTTIEMFDRVNITGNMVGGSYTNGTPNGENTIGTSAQNVYINIHGGEIFGNVYGGHYSSNTKRPDVLSIGNITITMDDDASVTGGGKVMGNIVGGGYRQTTNDPNGSSTQGEITINLKAGTLKGNVYAAGFNAGEDNGEVHTVTTSTHVIVESGFTFEQGTADADLNDGDLLISGGYGRKDKNVARGTIEEFAKLTFWGSNESINGWTGGDVTLRNVNVVEVWGTGEKIEVGGDLYVLRQNDNQKENFITKNGEGTLSVNRINSWGREETAASTSGYRGQIIVNDGCIKLTGASMEQPANEPAAAAAEPAYRQDLSGGLTVNLSTALSHYNSKKNAYLQAHDLKADGLGELYVNQLNENGVLDPEIKAKLTFTFGADSDTYSTLKNERTQAEPTLTKLHYGKYYLATGLSDEITRANKGDYFEYADAVKALQARINDWAKTNDQYKYYVADVQIIDHSLVLRVRDDREKFGWWWGCNADSDAHMTANYDKDRELEILHGEEIDDCVTWDDASSANWTQHITQDRRYDHENAKDPFTNEQDDAWNLTPRGQNLHFGTGGNGTEVELVNDSGKKNVAPRSVWVQDAQYTFVSSEENTDGDAVLSIGSDTEANVDESDLMFDRTGNPNTAKMLLAAGELRVGGDYWGEDADGGIAQNPDDAGEAELVLGVEVSNMTVASLYNGGALVLDHEKALVTDGDGATQIVFDGGLLGYTENSAKLGDLSAQVSEDSTGKIRIRVGNTKQGTYHNDELTKQDIPITWGNLTETELTSGVELALTNGFEKSGADDFTLLWASSAAPAEAYAGSIEVLEGELVYHHETLTTEHTMALSGEVSVASGTKLTFLETGANGTLSVAGKITGDGHVVIGAGADPEILAGGEVSKRTAGALHTPYSLSGDNSGFAGVLELLGASEVKVADLAGMNAAAALGGAGTTLRLAGRHLYFTTGEEKEIAVKSVQIVDGTVNYVGGFHVDEANKSINEANKSITITGELAWTNASGGSSAEQSGILANAWGKAGDGFHHTYDGASLSGFTGTILAGAGATKTGPTAYAAGVPDSSDSKWTLKDSSNSTTEIKVHLGGAGTFVFDYTQNIRLTGYVGVDEGASITDADKKTSISNAQAGKHIVTIADGENADWTTGSVNPDTSITDLDKVKGHNIATGSISGGFVLGDEKNYGTWSGEVLNGKAETALTLVNGVLKKALTKADGNAAKLNVETLLTGSKVDVGGTDGSQFDNITINAYGQMLGAAGVITVDGGNTKVNLTLTAGNVANAEGKPGDYLIVGGNDSVSMKVTKADDFTLNLSNDAFREMLKTAMDTTMSDAEKKTYLHIVGNGSLEIADDLHEGLLEKVHGANTALADMLGWSVVSDEQAPGDIILAYQSSPVPPEPPVPPVPPTPLDWHPHEVYLVIDEPTWKTYTDPHTVTDYGRMSSHFKATFIDDGQTLDVTLTGAPEDQVASDPQKPFPLPGDHQKGIDKDIAAGGALVNNLVGMADAHFNIHNGDTAQGRVNIVLNNMKYERTTDPDTEDGIYQGDRFYEHGVYGLDTEYWGELNADAGVDLHKTGWGRLTIGTELGTGYVKLADGTLTVNQGGMTLQGDDNALATLAFAYKTAEETAKGEERTFWLKNGKTTIGSITEANEAAAGRLGADIAMNGALLTLTGKSELEDSTIAGVSTSLMGDRLSEVQLMKDAVLALSGVDKAQLSNVGLILEANGTLDVGSNALNSVRGITGAGTLAGDGATLAVTDNLVDANARAYAFSGILSGKGNTMHVQKDAKLLLRNAIGGDGWDVTNHGTLILDVSGSPASEDHLTHLGDLTLGSGSTTTLIVNTDLKSRELPTISVNHLIADGGDFILKTTGKGALSNTTDSTLTGPRYGVAFVRAEDQERDALNMHGDDANLHFTMQGAATWQHKIVDAYIEGGVLWLQMEKRNEKDPFEGVAQDRNPQSGGNLASDAMDPNKNPHFGDISDPDSDLGKVIDSLLSDSDKGNHKQMNDTLAALAGSSTAVYGMVLAEDIHRQLRTTRNRAVMAGSERCREGVDCIPLYHAYILGESSYHRMSANGYAPGYTFSNWGGTVGLDVDLQRTEEKAVNMGLSLTAMYGDLRVNGPDRLRADMDTSYISGYLRVERGKWMHTLSLAAGLTELNNIKRTVNYSGGSYTTYGSTDGYSLGAIYEAAYSAYTNEAGTKNLQIVGNVEVRHIALNGYTETGSDAALHIGDVTQDIVTFGLGARYRAVVGEHTWNRNSIFESRLLVKVDAGDRTGVVATSLVKGSSRQEKVESAELGAVGVEAGVGLTVPVGRCGCIFFDASLEARDHYIHADANVGYRMTF